MIRYKSTRGHKEEKRSSQAIIEGLAPDKGLYVPTSMPELPFNLSDMKDASYQQVAAKVISAFFPDFTREEIENCVKKAYDEKFSCPEIAKLVKAGAPFFLELYHGSTAAFKDMALSILPHFLTTALKKEGEHHKICILTATSGDTGKAALQGFADVEGTEIAVFYPSQGVSQVQKAQMITQEGRNVHVHGIEGNFDQAQSGVKKIFTDDEFAEKLLASGVKLSSANSINIGRLIPQVVYYVYSYLQLLAQGAIAPGDKINVVVPTGNFGNILAAYYAKAMGLPVNKFICASNENRVLTDFINTGVYDINRDFYLTTSPSMDILISSNLERLLYHLSEGDTGLVAQLMKCLETEGRYQVPEKVKEGLSCFYGGCATSAEGSETIRRFYEKHHYLMDTHTAVAAKVYEDYRAATGDETVTVIASTASPYKFADSVGEALGLSTSDSDDSSHSGRNCARGGNCSSNSKDSQGFAAIEMLNSETKVAVPKGLQGLDKKPVLHKGVISPEDMADAVLSDLKIQ